MADFWPKSVRLYRAARAVGQALARLEEVREQLRDVDGGAALFAMADAQCETVGDLQLKIEVMKNAA